MHLSIDGLGIIVYSPFATAHIHQNEDYLQRHYWQYEDMIAHIYQGTIVGFGTGSPGQYLIHLFKEPVGPQIMENAEVMIHLGIEVQDNTLCFRDLYDLMAWDKQCPEGQMFEIPSGYYRMTLCTRLPPSSVRGDQQDIWISFEQTERLPDLSLDDIPKLYKHPPVLKRV